MQLPAGTRETQDDLFVSEGDRLRKSAAQWRTAAAVAAIDPHYPPARRAARAKYYQKEAERLEDAARLADLERNAPAGQEEADAR